MGGIFFQLFLQKIQKKRGYECSYYNNNNNHNNHNNNSNNNKNDNNNNYNNNQNNMELLLLIQLTKSETRLSKHQVPKCVYFSCPFIKAVAKWRRHLHMAKKNWANVKAEGDHTVCLSPCCYTPEYTHLHISLVLYITRLGCIF